MAGHLGVWVSVLGTRWELWTDRLFGKLSCSVLFLGFGGGFWVDRLVGRWGFVVLAGLGLTM